jgi:hypothetical protein
MAAEAVAEMAIIAPKTRAETFIKFERIGE